MNKLGWIAFVFSMIGAASGCVVVESPGDDGGSGADDVGGAGGSGNGDEEGAGDSGGSGGSGAADGGGDVACPVPGSDALALQVTDWNGAQLGCGEGMVHQSDLTATGVVVEADASTLRIDLDGSNQAPKSLSFKATSPGLALAIPVATMVQLRFVVQESKNGCGVAAVITSAPEFNDVPNPYSTEPVTLFAGFDGPYFDEAWQELAIDEVLQARPRTLACGGHPAATDDGPRSAEWRFASPAGTDKDMIEVTMGETTDWNVGRAGKDYHYTVRNLRSYTAAGPDRNWAFWLTNPNPY